MKGWSLLLFAIGFLGVIAGCIWLNTAVFCLADAKFDRGCGGFDLYFLIWAMFSAPLALAAGLVAMLAELTPRRRTLFLVASALVIGASVQLYWTVLPDDGRGLAAMYGVFGVALWAVYVLTRASPRQEPGRANSRPVV